jgi:hypothetical protein
VPFSLNMSSTEPQGPHRLSPSRGHGHSQSQGSLPRDLPSMPSPRYGRGPATMPPLIPPPTPGGRPLSSRRESLPPRPSYGPPPEQADYGYGPAPGFGLAPIQTSGLGPGPGGGPRGGMLPGVAELTTGISPYSTPAYSIGGGPSTTSPVNSATASPGPLLPALSPYPPMEPGAGVVGPKRRAASPDVGGGVGIRESTRRRHLHPQRPGEQPAEYPPILQSGLGPGPGPAPVPTRRAPRNAP